jgi:hypothetical protein
VWRYPDFLIIILKRFVYLERGPGGVAGSLKLDNRVEFPLQDLDLNPYLSGRPTVLRCRILTSTPTSQVGQPFSAAGSQPQLLPLR